MASLPSFRSLARVATGAMALTPALLLLGTGVGMAGRAWTLSELRSPDFTYADVDGAFSAVGTATLVTVTLFSFGAVTWAVVFVAWLYRARRNLDRIEGARPRWGPGWTVVSWFIPIANLILPGAVIADVARESVPLDQRHGSRPAWMMAAWRLSLAGLLAVTTPWPFASAEPHVISMIYSSESDPISESLRAELAAQVGAVAPPPAEIVLLVLCAAVAIPGIMVVRRVTALQAAALDDVS